jgi:hypothetical protein
VDRAGRGVALWTESARDQHKRDMQRALAEKVARRRREIETAREAERARIRRALDLRRDSARRVQPPPVPEA